MKSAFESLIRSGTLNCWQKPRSCLIANNVVLVFQIMQVPWSGVLDCIFLRKESIYLSVTCVVALTLNGCVYKVQHLPRRSHIYYSYDTILM